MRWEYESPQKKLFVADGKVVWFFVPADHTVRRAPMKESVDWRTPLALLTGKTKLSNLCARIDIDLAPAPSAPGHVTLRCLPRGEGKKSALASSGAVNGDASLAGPDQPFDQVLLEVDRETGELADVRVLQPGGIELDFRFGNWVENLPLSQSSDERGPDQILRATPCLQLDVHNVHDVHDRYSRNRFSEIPSDNPIPFEGPEGYLCTLLKSVGALISLPCTGHSRRAKPQEVVHSVLRSHSIPAIGESSARHRDSNEQPSRNLCACDYKIQVTSERRLPSAAASADCHQPFRESSSQSWSSCLSQWNSNLYECE
jgi:hypothetical protein